MDYRYACMYVIISLTIPLLHTHRQSLILSLYTIYQEGGEYWREWEEQGGWEGLDHWVGVWGWLGAGGWGGDLPRRRRRERRWELQDLRVK